MKPNNFRGELADISALKKPLVLTHVRHVLYSDNLKHQIALEMFGTALKQFVTALNVVNNPKNMSSQVALEAANVHVDMVLL